MSGKLKILKFVGVDKKEQVLLKSFLNLAKDELEFDLQIDENHQSPNVIVFDEKNAAEADAFSDAVLKITIGTSASADSVSDQYISRPLQWSHFKNALDKLADMPDVPEAPQQAASPPEPEAQPAQAQVAEQPTQQPVPEQAPPQPVPQQAPSPAQQQVQQPAAPQQVPQQAPPPAQQQPAQQPAQQQVQQPAQQVPVQQPAPQPQETQVVEFFPGTKEHDEAQFSTNAGEWELDESIQVDAPPVEKEEAVPEDELGQLYALNDETEESPSEFLSGIEEMVIETDKVDEWEKSETTTFHSQSTGGRTQSIITGDYENSEISQLTVLLDDAKSDTDEKVLGESVGNGIIFWAGDMEILINNHPVFIIKTKRNLVYTEYEPHKWYKIFASDKLRKRKLDNKWKPYGRLESYPLKWMDWCAYITRSNGVLTQGIDKKDLFRLESWPSFSLLQNDNNLLKLCSITFANPESPRSLVVQSKLRAKTIVGFLNACNAMGLLSRHGNEEGGAAKGAGAGSSMTWFKGLFK